MKGLSPVVASIIMIAFAVAVGGLVSIWLTGFATETTETTSDKGNRALECSGVILKVERVTDSQIVFSNPSSEPITDITVYDDVGRNLTFNVTDLNPGQFTNASWTRANNVTVFMRGLCEGEVIVEGSCEEGRVCWK